MATQGSSKEIQKKNNLGERDLESGIEVKTLITQTLHSTLADVTEIWEKTRRETVFVWV